MDDENRTVKMTNPREIKTHETFSSLFPINPELLDQITADMKDRWYDDSQAIICGTWEGQEEPVCIDGHTRLQAALDAEVEQVPVFTQYFQTEDEAIDQSIRLQRNRRNMTDAEVIKLVELLYERKQRGGDRRSEEAKSIPPSGGIENPGSSTAKDVGEKIGKSSRKVERAARVLSQGGEEVIKAVKDGKKSINQAEKDIAKAKKAAKQAESTSEAQPDQPEAVPPVQEAQPEQDSPEEDEPKVSQHHGHLVEISDDHYRALKAFGGDIKDVVADAIEKFLGHGAVIPVR